MCEAEGETKEAVLPGKVFIQNPRRHANTSPNQPELDKEEGPQKEANSGANKEGGEN